jgi:hypothetical protein
MAISEPCIELGSANALEIAVEGDLAVERADVVVHIAVPGHLRDESWTAIGREHACVVRFRQAHEDLSALGRIDDDANGKTVGGIVEEAPFVFAEQLLRMGSGATRKMVSEIERIRQLHVEQTERDKGQPLDRFLAQHYIRLHTVPLGQWMAMDFAHLAKLWNEAPVATLVADIKEKGPRLGPQNAQVVEQVVGALARAKQDEPVAKQTTDRGLFEAIAQIIALRRATAPVAIDILERVVMPALHVGVPDKFPPLDDDDLANLRKGIELFAFFVEVIPHKFQADDEGFLGTIPHDQLTTPYGDRSTLEIGKGDWVIVNPAHFVPMFREMDPQKLLDKYDEFVKYVATIPEAPRRRDDGRMLAETAVRALADLKQCVATAAQNKDALLFRLVPPPG